MHEQRRGASAARRTALGFAALLAAAPMAAWADPIALYPLQGKDLSPQALAQVQRVVVKGARAFVDDLEDDTFTLGDQPVVAAKCGAAGSASATCLRRLAGDGVLIFGTAEAEGDDVVVTLALIDARGLLSRTVWFREKLTILATGPAMQAVGELARAKTAGLLTPTRESQRTARQR